MAMDTEGWFHVEIEDETKEDVHLLSEACA